MTKEELTITRESIWQAHKRNCGGNPADVDNYQAEKKTELTRQRVNLVGTKKELWWQPS